MKRFKTAVIGAVILFVAGNWFFTHYQFNPAYFTSAQTEPAHTVPAVKAQPSNAVLAPEERTPVLTEAAVHLLEKSTGTGAAGQPTGVQLIESTPPPFFIIRLDDQQPLTRFEYDVPKANRAALINSAQALHESGDRMSREPGEVKTDRELLIESARELHEAGERASRNGK